QPTPRQDRRRQPARPSSWRDCFTRRRGDDWMLRMTDSGPAATDRANDGQVHYASRGSTHFDVILALFAVVLVVSNIAATKATQVGAGHLSIGSVQILPIVTDGGAFLFPLAYILGDVISE